MMPAASIDNPCPVCGGQTSLHDSLNANKTCADIPRCIFPVSQEKIAYYLCSDCTFCFAPEMYRWSAADFKTKIYNDDYVLADPDYAGTRAENSAESLKPFFEWVRNNAKIRHLDYGGGNGGLAQLLTEAGYDSRSYDPFTDAERDIDQGDKFNFITAYEVFEHASDVKKMMADITALLAPDGIVVFSTLMSDGQINAGQKLDWWYAAPRNGHISLFSKDSLNRLAAQSGFIFGSLDTNRHIFWRKQPPAWAYPLLMATDAGQVIQASNNPDQLRNFLGITS